MSTKSNRALLFVVLIIFGAVLGHMLTHITAVKPAQKLNALHMQAWVYVINLDAGTKILDSFILPITVRDATAGSLVLKIKKDKNEYEYVVFVSDDIEDAAPLHFEAEYLIPRQ